MKRVCLTVALLAALLAIAGVQGKTITQIVCSDSACSDNCGAMSYEQGACYTTLQSGSTVQIYCQSDDTVINQVIYPESSDCSGFNYDYPVSAGSCVSGQYDYIEYICGSLSASTAQSRRIRNATRPRPVDAAPLVVIPAPTSAWRRRNGRVGEVRAQGTLLLIPSDVLPKGLQPRDFASATVLLNMSYTREGVNKPLRTVPVPFEQLVEVSSDHIFAVRMDVLNRFVPSVPKEARFNRGKQSRRSTIFVSVTTGKDEGATLLTLSLPAPLAKMRR